MSWVLGLSIILSIFVCIYVRLIRSGYLFFCIYYNVVSHAIQNEELCNLHTRYKVTGEVLVLGLLVVYKIPYSSCMWKMQDVIGVFPSYYCNVRACNSPVYHYIAATVVYLVQRVIAACVVVIWFERSEFLIATSKKKKTVRLPVCTRVRLILVLVWKKLSWF